jgi:hypothetical protein
MRIENSVTEALPAAIKEVVDNSNPIFGKWIAGRHILDVVVARSNYGVIRMAFREFVMANEAEPYAVKALCLCFR